MSSDDDDDDDKVTAGQVRLMLYMLAGAVFFAVVMALAHFYVLCCYWPGQP